MRVPSTKGQYIRIDREDFNRVAEHSWCVLDLRSRRNGLMYAMSRINWKIVYLHRFITNAPKGSVVDHINGDGLDNRKSNLRVVSRSVNHLNRRGLASNNRSGVNGVFWSSAKGKYRAEIVVNRTKYHLGYFKSKTAATNARKAAEKRLIQP